MPAAAQRTQSCGRRRFCKNKPNRPFEGPRRGPLGSFENTNPMSGFCAQGKEREVFDVEPLRPRWAITADENGWPKGRDRCSRKTCNVRFSNNRWPTLRTPCGEKESAPISKSIFEARASRTTSIWRTAARHDRRKLFENSVRRGCLDSAVGRQNRQVADVSAN